MIKMRLSYYNTKIGKQEFEEALDIIKKEFDVLIISKRYNARTSSKMFYVYLELETKNNNL